jgi:hypothetical protein
MFKVTTKHGTYYLIDFEKNRALRVRGPYSHEIIRDNVWFAFSSVFAFDRDAKEPEDRDKGDIQIGHSMYFNLRSFERISWIISSEVVSIEEVEEDVHSGI